MPVEDHAVHPKTKVGKDFRYGCNHGKPPLGGFYVLTRKYFPDGRYELANEYIQDTSSNKCRYLSFGSDSGCLNCLQPKDYEYINKMKELK